MDFWVIVIIVFAVAAAFIAICTAMVSEKTKALADEVQGAENFTATQMAFSCDGKSGIAFDDARGAICLVLHEGALVTRRVLPASEILSVELFEDGNSVTKTARGSQLGGAIIGGIALGGVGAIIGGLSGKTKTSNKITSVTLRITVNDVSKPLHDVAFLNFEVEKTNILYKQAIEKARHWHGVLDVLIKRADANNSAALQKGSAVMPFSLASVADEIKKLVELKDAGVLSDTEFQQEKTRLLTRA